MTRATEADRDTARRAFLRFLDGFDSGRPVPEIAQIAFLSGMGAGVAMIGRRAPGDPVPPALSLAVSDLWDELNVIQFMKAGEHVNRSWAEQAAKGVT